MKQLVLAAFTVCLLSCHARDRMTRQHTAPEKYVASLRPPGTTIKDGITTTVTYPSE